MGNIKCAISVILDDLDVSKTMNMNRYAFLSYDLSHLKSNG